MLDERIDCEVVVWVSEIVVDRELIVLEWCLANFEVLCLVDELEALVVLEAEGDVQLVASR